MAKSLFEELGGKYDYLRNWAANTKGKGII